LGTGRKIPCTKHWVHLWGILVSICLCLVFCKAFASGRPEAMGFTDWQGGLSAGLDMELAPAACVCSEKFVWDLMIMP
jgi:hypothetical protein